ncbi:43669_t:CDS:2 [Gigaspora margarita]|uniref:43669_t:CDS:1 n=1 Tax=Gigaspora margarita TaxID=4874 RepID=A0ABN7VZW8_GIGMA|nr:43669_t:CDS:2 [Gigaspora margarita]
MLNPLSMEPSSGYDMITKILDDKETECCTKIKRMIRIPFLKEIALPICYDRDLYNKLSNDFISSYQARINVNTNYLQASNLLLDAQLQQDPAFELTKNICTLQLYSGTLGAILNNLSNNNWFYHSLIDANDWLKVNNYLFRQFNQILSLINNIHPQTNFSTMQLIDNKRNIIPSIASLQNQPNLVVLPNDFNTEIHNKDFITID